MKINVFKAHPSYPVGPHEVGEARGKYLIQTGFAEAESEDEGDDPEKPKAPKKTAAKKQTPKKAAPKKAAVKMK